jgi:hypothetical protein
VTASNAAALAATLTLACLPAAVHAQGTDELWEVNMKMEMAGAPIQMPEQNQRVCKPKGKPEEAAIPDDGKCRMIESKQAGRRHTFKMACEDGKNKYTIAGETESTGPDNYRGKMRTTGSMDGEPMDMTQTFSGRKVGNCTYEDPAKQQREMLAQHDAMLAKECRKFIDDLQPAMFTMQGSPCTSLKPEFCARVSKVAAEMRDAAGFRRYAGKDWEGSMQACGQDPAGLKRDVCKASAAKKDWAFVGETCEEDAKALARQHCEGRSYTAAMGSEYAPICSRYAANMGGRSYTALPASGAAEQKPGAAESIKKGADKLKKFLKF